MLFTPKFAVFTKMPTTVSYYSRLVNTQGKVHLRHRISDAERDSQCSSTKTPQKLTASTIKWFARWVPKLGIEPYYRSQKKLLTGRVLLDRGFSYHDKTNLFSVWMPWVALLNRWNKANYEAVDQLFHNSCYLCMKFLLFMYTNYTGLYLTNNHFSAST